MEQASPYLEELPDEYRDLFECIGSNAIRLALRKPFCEIDLNITADSIDVAGTLVPHDLLTQKTDDQLAELKAEQDSLAVATARNVLTTSSEVQMQKSLSSARIPATAAMYRSKNLQSSPGAALKTTSLAVRNATGQLTARRTFIWTANAAAAEGLDFTQMYPGNTIATARHVMRPINDERQMLWNLTFRSTPETQKIRGKLFAGSPADEFEIDRLLDAARDYLHKRHDISVVETVISKLREEAISAMESRRLASETGADIPTIETLERTVELTSQALAA